MVGQSSGVAHFGTLAGSLRQASYSRLLARCLPALAPAGIRIGELGSVGDLPHFDQDLMAEAVPRPAADLAAQIAELDGLILVSPEYNWSIPGVLKNALDWLSRLDPMPLGDLPVLIVTCSPGLLGGARAHPPIRNVLHALDCRILARPEIQISRIAGKLDPASVTVSDPDTAEFLRQRLADFAHFARGSGRA